MAFQALLRCHEQLIRSRYQGGGPLGTALPMGPAPYSPLEIIVGSWEGAQPLPAGLLGQQQGHAATGSSGFKASSSGSSDAGAAAVSEARDWAEAAATRVISVSSTAVGKASGAAKSNPSQRAAMEAAAGGVLSIIHGPPGTGKVG